MPRTHRAGARGLHAAALLLCAASLTALASCASDPQRSIRYWQQRTARLVPRLEAERDADALAAAAVLDLQRDPEGRLELIARATALAPDRPALAWLHLSMCHPRQGCDPTALEDRLRSIDPANGAVWLSAAERAVAAADDDALADALDHLGRSASVRLYWAPLVHDLAVAVARTHQWDLREAMTAIIGAVAGATIPALGPTSHACQDASLEQPHRIETCRGIAAAMINGDTLIVEMVGFGIGKRVWSADSPQGKQLRAAERVARYRMREGGKLNEFVGTSQQAASRFLDDLALYPVEDEMLRIQLLRAGKPAEPSVADPPK